MSYNKIEKQLEKQLEKEFEKRDAECTPVALEILKIIADANLPIGAIADKTGLMKDDVNTEYNKVAEKILLLFLKNDIKWSDREYVFKLAFQAYEQSKIKVLDSLTQTFEKANERLWGKELMELRMVDINKQFE